MSLKKLYSSARPEINTYKNDIKKVNNIFKNDTIPGEIAKNIHLFISQSGVVTHEFKAPILYTFHSPETYQPYSFSKESLGLLSFFSVENVSSCKD